MIAVGVSALLVWGVAMWRRGGQYEGKMHRLLALAGVIVSFGAYSLVTDLAVENRVVSTYFGNIALPRACLIQEFRSRMIIMKIQFRESAITEN